MNKQLHRVIKEHYNELLTTNIKNDNVIKQGKSRQDLLHDKLLALLELNETDYNYVNDGETLLFIKRFIKQPLQGQKRQVQTTELKEDIVQYNEPIQFINEDTIKLLFIDYQPIKKKNSK